MTDKRRAKRRLILETATALFSQRGYQATRMQDIAFQLGMQAGSLYYYFESKEALLSAVVEANVGLAVRELDAIVSGPGTAINRMRAAVASHLAVFDRQSDLYKIFVSERLDAIAPELAEAVDELGRAYEQRWVSLIGEGIATGELRSDLDPWLTMKAVVGLCNSTLFWFTSDGRLATADVADAFSGLVVEGLAAHSELA